MNSHRSPGTPQFGHTVIAHEAPRRLRRPRCGSTRRNDAPRGHGHGVAGFARHLALETITVTELTALNSPSGNIGCYIDPNSVRCDIQERDWAPPPKPASCNENVGWGQGLTLSVGEPASFVCAGDTALTTGDPLAFGDKIVAGPIECTSAESGIPAGISSTAESSPSPARPIT